MRGILRKYTKGASRNRSPFCAFTSGLLNLDFSDKISGIGALPGNFIMAKKKHKIKKHYTIAVTSDYSVDKTRYYRSRVDMFKVSLITTVAAVILGVGLTAFEFYELGQMESKLIVLRSIISEQKDIITELGDQKAELTAQNQVLANSVAMAVADKEQAEAEDAKRHIPSAFPLSTSAAIVDISVMDEKEEELAGYFTYDADTYTPRKAIDIEPNPISVFELSSASDVVAAADGNVIAITDDELFTKCIIIDHGNGYSTIYRNNSDPKVNVGDDVVKGAILFVGGEDNIYLGYQITYENEYLDPMTVIAIDG